MARTFAILLFIISYVFVIHIVHADKIDNGRFKEVAHKVQVIAYKHLQTLLKKYNINCDTFEDYCSKIIEGSPSLKTEAGKFQSTCEEKLKLYACDTAEMGPDKYDPKVLKFLSNLIGNN